MLIGYKKDKDNYEIQNTNEMKISRNIFKVKAEL